ERVEDPDTPKTVAVSPVASLKDRIESMAVDELAPASTEAAPTIQPDDSGNTAE
ncbi:hypothetical protein IWW55_007473, partial [Coemansia sp. RSA 2706]